MPKREKCALVCEKQDLSDTYVSDIAALSELTCLESLKLSSTDVSDISALTGLAILQTFDLRKTNVRDFTVLKHLTNLETLYMTEVESKKKRAIEKLLPEKVDVY